MEWVEISELPEKAGYYLCVIKKTDTPKIREFKENKISGKLEFVSNGVVVNNVTHWMELPKLPNDI